MAPSRKLVNITPTHAHRPEHRPDGIDQAPIDGAQSSAYEALAPHAAASKP
jgi:hypothetical protein